MIKFKKKNVFLISVLDVFSGNGIFSIFDFKIMRMVNYENEKRIYRILFKI